MKRSYLIIAIFFALLTGQACTEKEQLLDVVGNIEGTVRDFGTQLTLSDVTVDIVSNSNAAFEKRSAETGSDGKFSFNSIETGSYNVSFVRSGYPAYSKDVDVLAGQTVSCDAMLQIDPDFGVVNGVLKAYFGKGGSVVIPENVGITDIGRSVFKNNAEVTSVVIPKGVMSIGSSAFEECENLTSVTIPSTVVTIEERAFYHCQKLASLTLPEGVSTIKDYAFAVCFELTSIAIPNSVTTLGRSAFDGCRKVANVNIGSGLTQIGVDAFRELSRLLSFTVDSNNKSYMAEEGILFNKTKTELIKCPVTKTGVYTVPSTVTSIADYAFVYCYYLNSVVIGANVAQIGRGVFFNCDQLTSLVVGSENEHYTSDDGVLLNKAKTTLVRYPEGKSGEYVIPHTVTRIEYLAIAGCQNLTAVAIPSSVTFIEGYAVYNCENLTNVTVGWTTPPAISYNFSGVPLNAATLHVPAGTKATYEAANVWKEFGNIVEY